MGWWEADLKTKRSIRTLRQAQLFYPGYRLRTFHLSKHCRTIRW
nr:MAG TPA: hypothetical protein [Caudoviricetes sp.]